MEALSECRVLQPHHEVYFNWHNLCEMPETFCAEGSGKQTQTGVEECEEPENPTKRDPVLSPLLVG